MTPLRASHLALATAMLGAVMTVSGVSHAADEKNKKRVLLMPVERGGSVTTIVPREVAESLRTILSNNRTIEVLRPADLKKPEVELTVEKPKAKKKDKLLAKADKALWDAKELAGKEKFLGAAKLFKKAMSLYEKRFDKLVDFDKYVDAALGVSLSYFYAGYEDNGEDALAPVLILKPTTVLQARKVPKPAMEALDRLRKLYSRTSSGRIRVDSNPPGAVVYIDGVLRGQTPTMVSGLWRGQHVLRLTKDGFQATAKRFTASGREQTVKGTLKPIVVSKRKSRKKKGETALNNASVLNLVTKSMQTGKYGRRFGNAAAILAKEYNLDLIVMPYVRRAGRSYDLATFVYDAKIKRVAELEWVSFAADLADMQSKLLRIEEQILQGLVIFPRSRTVSRRSKSKIYDAYQAPAPPKPKVVKKPEIPLPAAGTRVPAPAPPANPRVVKRQPAPTPIRVKRPSPGRIKPVPAVSPAPPVARPPAPQPRVPVVAPAPPPTRRPAAGNVYRPVAPPPSYRPAAPVVPVRPAPVYSPRPAPVYSPRPAPAPAPVYSPRPAPAPAPVYSPRPAPAPAPVYSPRPAPAPAPVYSPRPGPTPTYGGVPAPTPVLVPRPAPGPGYGQPPMINPAMPVPDAGTISSPWYETWWFWSIVGGVAITTGTVLGLTLGEDEPQGFRTVVSWGAQ